MLSYISFPGGFIRGYIYSSFILKRLVSNSLHRGRCGSASPHPPQQAQYEQDSFSRCWDFLSGGELFGALADAKGHFGILAILAEESEVPCSWCSDLFRLLCGPTALSGFARTELE